MTHAIVSKAQSDYHIVLHFEVREGCRCLPNECNGIFVFIQVRNPESLTCCELFACNNFIKEYRIYNIDNSKLDIAKLHRGKTILECR